MCIPRSARVRDRRYNSAQAGDLALEKGARIQITRQDASGWWYGTLLDGPKAGQAGLFPSNYVKMQ